jgi:hypothetical protein
VNAPKTVPYVQKNVYEGVENLLWFLNLLFYGRRKVVGMPSKKQRFAP